MTRHLSIRPPALGTAAWQKARRLAFSEDSPSRLPPADP